jgi:hypothetical protein
MEYFAVFKVEVTDIPLDLESKLAIALSNEALISRTISIAQKAGVILLNHAVQACIDSVYGASSDTTDPEHEYERTLALLDSHIVQDNGLEQFVGIDPDAEAIDPHSGRELVLDYAIPQHEGYTQFFMGKNTGQFHAGKFWFDTTVTEGAPIIFQYINQAYEEIIIEVLSGVFG